MSPIVRERLRVPRDNRTTFFRPDPSEWPALVRENRRLLTTYDVTLGGNPFAPFRAAARAEIVALARAWTKARGFQAPGWAEPRPVIIAGHQPAPFHPGVWIKNFAAGALADAVGGVALNLNVDNDQPHAAAFRVPAVDLTCKMGGDECRTADVAFAPPPAGLAFEELPPDAIRDDAAREAAELLPPSLPTDGLRRFWDLLLDARSRAANLGEAFVVARRRLEEEHGLHNLELPVSRLADSRAFVAFLAAFLARHDDFFRAYNESLAEFRHVFHETSPAQPVPDLARDGRRMELPYWIWRRGEPRQRLWVEPVRGGGLGLAYDDVEIGRLSAADLADPDAAAPRLADLGRAGWKIRPRALSMTLFVRLAVGDVFIHGLGGALYDKITDAIIHRLFHAAPPRLILASCTVHLPLPAHPETQDDCTAAERAVRDWRYNPDRMLPASLRRRDDVRALVDEKRRLLENRAPTRGARADAWRRVRDLNRRLAAVAPEVVQAAHGRLRDVRRALRYNAVLRNREVPFFLHPPDDLVAFYRDALRLRPSTELRARTCAWCGAARKEPPQ